MKQIAPDNLENSPSSTTAKINFSPLVCSILIRRFACGFCMRANRLLLMPHGGRRELDQALARREGLFDANTTGYRLIHGESDGWPGLVLDRYDTTLVLKIYTAAWLPWLDEILALFQERNSMRTHHSSIEPEHPGRCGTSVTAPARWRNRFLESSRDGARRSDHFSGKWPPL